MGKFKGLEAELEKLRDRIEEENTAKADIQRALSRNVAEAQIWKSKYSTEALARIEDLENAKCKLMARINEAEECIEGLTLKVHATEKIRNRYAIDLEDLQMEYERISSAIAVAEKKMKNFDLVVGEWKLKCDDITTEVEASQRDCRNINSEMFRLKVNGHRVDVMTERIHLSTFSAIHYISGYIFLCPFGCFDMASILC